MSRYVIGFTTIDRSENNPKKRNYMEQTIENLIAVGALNFQDTKIIISDSGSKDLSYLDFLKPLMEQYKDRIILLRTNRRLTANENVSKVIRYASEFSSEYVMYCQDDIIFRTTFMENVDHFVKKYNGYPMFTFHGVYDGILRNANNRKDYYRYPYGDFYGSMCYVMRKEVASRWSSHLQWIWEATKDPIGADLHLGRWLKREFPNSNIAASCPCFVQHVGIDSVICKGQRPIQNQSFNNFFLKPPNKRFYEMVKDIQWDKKGYGKFIWSNQ